MPPKRNPPRAEGTTPASLPNDNGDGATAPPTPTRTSSRVSKSRRALPPQITSKTASADLPSASLATNPSGPPSSSSSQSTSKQFRSSSRLARTRTTTLDASSDLQGSLTNDFVPEGGTNVGDPPQVAMAASSIPAPSDAKSDLIQVAIARAVKRSYSRLQDRIPPRPSQALKKKANTSSCRRIFDLLATTADLPPGKEPRITSTMNQDQIVASMLSDMGIKNVNKNRDLDLTGQPYDQAMINVSAPLSCLLAHSSISTLCYSHNVLFAHCSNRKMCYLYFLLLTQTS